MHAQGDKCVRRRVSARPAAVPNTFSREPRGGGRGVNEDGGLLGGSDMLEQHGTKIEFEPECTGRITTCVSGVTLRAGTPFISTTRRQGGLD